MPESQLADLFTIESGKQTYVSWCETNKWNPQRYAISRILAFCQLGVDVKLALSTIKGQISALSVFFQRPPASHSLVQAFIQSASQVFLVPIGSESSIISVAEATL